MKIFYRIFCCTIVILINFYNVRVFSADLTPASKNISGEIQYIYPVNGSDIVFLGTDKGLYASVDSGDSWERILLPGGGIDVRMLEVSGDKAVMAASGGLYIGKKIDGEYLWNKIEGRSGIMGASLFPEDDVLVWGRDFLSGYAAGVWKDIGKGSSWRDIDDVRILKGNIYVLCSDGLFFSLDSGETWEKIRLSRPHDEIDPEFDLVEEGSLEESRKGAGRFDRYSQDVIYLATRKGIIGINGDNSLHKIGTTGLPSSSVEFAVHSPQGLVTATDKNVYLFNGKTGGWDAIFKVSSAQGISAVAVHEDGHEDTWIWIGSKRHIYKERIFGRYDLGFSSPDKKALYEAGPSILEVQKMAIDHAEVSPDKIKKWRARARWKALLPKLSVGFSESVDDNVEIYKSSSRYYIVNGPTERGSDWDLDLSWDLSDLIWNDAQTAIDVRSKLMVQLREDILEEVTRLYFERKRLVEEIGLTDPSADKKLRLEELTAYIDAYTGGRFSRRLSTS